MLNRLGSRLRHRLFGAAALVGVLAMAGCSSAPTTAAKVSSITVYDGATGQFTDNFNPLLPTANTATTGLIYQPLMFFNQAKSDDVQPLMATSYAWSPDGKTLTFTLRSGKKWSDGQPYTAQDVAFTFNLLKSDPKLNGNGLPLAGAQAIDDTHVSVSFTVPAYADLWYAAGLTYILPEHIWSKIDNPETNPNTNPVGSGPFTLKSFAAQSYVLAKNTNYWDTGKPYLDEMRYVSYSGNDPALTGLLAHQVDWSGIFIPNIEKTYVAKSKDNKYVSSALNQTNLVANTAQWPGSDLAVRQAIYYGIDRDQLNKLAFSGYSTPLTPGELLLPRDGKWLASDLKNVFPTFDPQKAQQILQQAGYTKGGDGIFVDPKGRRLSITVKVVTGYTDFIAALQVMQQQLAKVGIEIRPQEVSHSAFIADEGTGNYQMTLDNLNTGPTPFFLYNRYYNSANSAPIGQVARNTARFHDPVVDQALATAAGTNDEAVQAAAYARIQHEIVQQIPYIPVLQPGSLTEYNAGKFSGWPSENNLYAIPRASQHPDLGVVAANIKPAG